MENNIVKVKDLPQIEEILPGNYILVEESTGTKILDFRDFVIGPDNTSFYNALANNIRSISAYSDSLSATIRTSTGQTIRAVDNRFVALTSSFVQAFTRIFYLQGTVNIPQNQITGTSQFRATLDNINITNINIVPITYDAGGTAGSNRVLPVAVGLEREQLPVGTDQDTSLPPLFQYSITLSAGNAARSGGPTHTFLYSVMRPY